MDHIDGFQSLTDLFGNPRIAERYKPSGKKIASERAILIGYFARKMEWEPSRVSMWLAHVKDLRDLYYLKSDCDQAEVRGVPFSAAFRSATKVVQKVP